MKYPGQDSSWLAADVKSRDVPPVLVIYLSQEPIET